MVVTPPPHGVLWCLRSRARITKFSFGRASGYFAPAELKRPAPIWASGQEPDEANRDHQSLILRNFARVFSHVRLPFWKDGQR